MRVNIFKRRAVSERQPRAKNGSPPHATTGVASSNCHHAAPPPTPLMAMTTSGNVSAALRRSRRVMSASSGLSSSPGCATSGSNAIPHNGQSPGASVRICGSIGQV